MAKIYSDDIRVNVAYVATPTFKGLPNKIVIVAGRQGRSVTVFTLDDMAVGNIDDWGTGHEMAQVKFDGQTYNICSSSDLDNSAAVEVLDYFRRRHRERVAARHLEDANA